MSFGPQRWTRYAIVRQRAQPRFTENPYNAACPVALNFAASAGFICLVTSTSDTDEEHMNDSGFLALIERGCTP